MDFGFLVFRSLILFIGIVFFVIGAVEANALFSKKNQSKKININDILATEFLLLIGTVFMVIAILMER